MTPTASGTVNWAEILQVIEEIIALLNATTPPTPTPASVTKLHAKAKSVVGSIVANPTTVDDILSTNDTYVALSSFLAADGVTDPGILAAVATATATNLQNGATAVLAYETENPGDGAPLVFSHLGVNYEVDDMATPPTIVLSTVLDAASIPYPAPTPPAPPQKKP